MLAPAHGGRGQIRHVMLIFLKRFLREPLFHFLASGALLFAFYAVVSPTGGEDEGLARIVVTPEQVARLREAYQDVWGRPPDDDALAGLIDNHVRQEVLYREALQLGLDRGDALIRRRLNQKMEFLAGSGVELLEPTDAELGAYLTEHAERYRVPGEVAFRQLFLGEAAQPDGSDAMLEELRRRPLEADLADLGVPTLLPPVFGPATGQDVRSLFGASFADALLDLEPGAWLGPVRSGYGWHLVMVTHRVSGRLPSLDEVRATLERDWRAARASELRDQAYRELRARYVVEIQDGGPA